MTATTTTGDDTVPGQLAHCAAAQPDAPFLAFDAGGELRTTRTWAEMAERARATAGLLARLGLGRGGRLHVHLPNHPAFYDCWLGAAVAGAAIVPTNPLATADELRYTLDHARCGATVTTAELAAAVRAARPNGAHPVLLVDGQATRPDHFETALAAADGANPVDNGPGPEDVLGILYTSGTTSRPKGVLVTHAAYLHAGEVVAQHIRLRPDDRALIVLPLHHGNAQYYSTMSALVTGASVGLVDRFSASGWSASATRLGATVASLFAAPIRMLLAHPPAPTDRAHRLRLTLYSQNVTAEQAAAFETRFGTRLVQLYGLTETVFPPTINPIDGRGRHETIGRPTLAARVRIVAADGADVAPGTAGELLVAGVPGRTLMAGYLDNPTATAAAMADGWLRTGDTVRLEPDGHLVFLDRGADLIKRAGENISSGEVERVLEQHPAVFEAAVIGVAEEIRDEAVKAFVVLHDGVTVDTETLSAWCAQRLAAFKVPTKIAFVDSLPRTAVGKIRKHLLRDPPAPETRPQAPAASHRGERR